VLKQAGTSVRAILMPGRFVKQSDKVIEWNVQLNDSTFPKKKDLLRFDVERVILEPDYLNLSINIQGTRSSAYSVRDGLFSTKDAVFFVPSENAFMREIAGTLSCRLFKKQGQLLGFTCYEDALDFELDSHYWRMVYMKRHPDRITLPVDPDTTDEEEGEEEEQDEVSSSDSEDFDPTDFQVTTGDIFDLPEDIVSVHVSTKINTYKPTLKRMIIGGQEVVLQELVKSVFRFTIQSDVEAYGSMAYWVYKMFADLAFHELAETKYEEYTGFDILSFKDAAKSSDEETKKSAFLKLRRFKLTVLIYFLSSASFQLPKKIRNLRVFQAVTEDIGMERFPYLHYTAEDVMEAYRVASD
jgi:hypothetical protein